jgi:hypothetical protein
LLKFIDGAHLIELVILFLDCCHLGLPLRLLLGAPLCESLVILSKLFLSEVFSFFLCLLSQLFYGFGGVSECGSNVLVIWWQVELQLLFDCFLSIWIRWGISLSTKLRSRLHIFGSSMRNRLVPFCINDKFSSRISGLRSRISHKWSISVPHGGLAVTSCILLLNFLISVEWSIWPKAIFIKIEGFVI